MPNQLKIYDPEVQAAKDEGFAIAEGYLIEITKEFYKQMKRGLLTQMATTSTFSTHKCSCEFCKIDSKDIIKYEKTKN